MGSILEKKSHHKLGMEIEVELERMNCFCLFGCMTEGASEINCCSFNCGAKWKMGGNYNLNK